MKHDKSFDKYPHDKLIAVSSKGGIASGKARQEKRRRIDQEKIHDQAMHEMMRENAEIMRLSARVLLEAKRELDRKL